jgi:hypothetical protein
MHGFGELDFTHLFSALLHQIMAQLRFPVQIGH